MNFSPLIAAFDNHPLVLAVLAVGAALIVVSVAALGVRLLLGLVDGEAMRDDGLDDGVARWERELMNDDDERQDTARRMARRRRR